MDEARLEELIRKLHEAPDEWPETEHCPPFTALWAQVSSADPFSGRRPVAPPTIECDPAHVADCPRCRRVLEIMQQELAAAEGLERRARPTQRVPVVYRLAVPLAVAACVAAVFLIGGPDREQPSAAEEGKPLEEIVEMIAPYCDAVYGRRTASRLRGPTAEESHEARAALERFLTDPRVLAAKARHLGVRMALHREWQLGLITDNGQGYLTLTAAGLTCDRREELQDLVQQENETRDTFVEAIQVYVPPARENGQEDLRRALDRWLKTEVFGGG
jgi:hypothetical protein